MIPTLSARPKNRLLHCNIAYRYVGSPSNSFLGVISGSRGLVGPGPKIPQIDAALSPRPPEILQYCEPTHKRTLSDTTPLNDDRRTIVNNLPERAASTVGYQRQHAVSGIMQRLGTVEQGRNGPPIRSPIRSETLDTIETDVFWSTTPTTSKPGESTLNPPESPITIPRISIQADDSVPSDGSSFTVVDSSDYQHPAWADGAGTNRRARNSRGVDSARNDHGASDSRNSRGDSSLRKASDASPRKAEPQHRSPGQRTRADDYDPLALLSARSDRDPAALSLLPIVQTPSRSSSIRKKGKTLTYNYVL